MLHAQFSTIVRVWADAGYAGRLAIWTRKVLALTLRVVKRTKVNQPRPSTRSEPPCPRDAEQGEECDDVGDYEKLWDSVGCSTAPDVLGPTVRGR